MASECLNVSFPPRLDGSIAVVPERGLPKLLKVKMKQLLVSVWYVACLVLGSLFCVVQALVHAQCNQCDPQGPWSRHRGSAPTWGTYGDMSMPWGFYEFFEQKKQYQELYRNPNIKFP
jgi:hypothetical protein